MNENTLAFVIAGVTIAGCLYAILKGVIEARACYERTQKVEEDEGRSLSLSEYIRLLFK